jgi:hypothetical protein
LPNPCRRAATVDGSRDSSGHKVALNSTLQLAKGLAGSLQDARFRSAMTLSYSVLLTVVDVRASHVLAITHYITTQSTPGRILRLAA